MTTPDRDDNLGSQQQVQISFWERTANATTPRERNDTTRTQRPDEIAFEGRER